MIIPPKSLAPDILNNILESIVTREGTDYGDQELSLANKVSDLKLQVEAGVLLLTYDEETETVNVISSQEYSSLNQ